MHAFGISDRRRLDGISEHRTFLQRCRARDLKFGDDIAAFGNFFRRALDGDGIDIVIDVRLRALRHVKPGNRNIFFDGKSCCEPDLKGHLLYRCRQVCRQLKQVICAEIGRFATAIQGDRSVVFAVADIDDIRLCCEVLEVIIYFDGDLMPAVREADRRSEQVRFICGAERYLVAVYIDVHVACIDARRIHRRLFVPLF